MSTILHSVQPSKDRSRDGYYGRVARFHLVWVFIVVIALYLGQLILPSPGEASSFYPFVAPAVYVVGALITAPVNFGISSLVRRIGHGRRRRSSAMTVSIVAWLLVGLLVGALAQDSPDEMKVRTAVVGAVAAVAFGAFMPLPRSRP